MFFAYKCISAGILALTIVAGTFSPAQGTIKRSDLLTGNDTLIQSSIDAAKLIFEPVVSGLSQPVFITNAGDSSDRLFIIERVGRVRIAKNHVLLSAPFLDMESIVRSVGSEQGLLSLAFHPQFESNGYFYTVHTNSAGSIVLHIDPLLPSR